MSTRVIGFEILTAPFVIAQLQLFHILSDVGAAVTRSRPAIFLTNALAGWEGPEQIKLNFPELQQEHEAARRVKRDAKIIVVLGNPPYNRFAGTALDEEADLVDHYKGIRRRAKQVKKKGTTDSTVVMVQDGDSQLYTRWGIRKQLLDDLYVRFFRLAEKRIGENAEYGVVSFISNSSYLTGRSHPLMRESLLSNFHELWIDNTHGNRLASERTPWGESCETMFSFGEGAGIKLGTCIITLVKHSSPKTSPAETPIHYRDFWGKADLKRRALLESLDIDRWEEARRAEAAERPYGPREYETFFPRESSRWMFSPRDSNVGYEAWPALDVFPTCYQGVNPNRGLAESVIDTDRERLVVRMRRYFSAKGFSELQALSPELTDPRARYEPERVWNTLRSAGGAYADHEMQHPAWGAMTDDLYINSDVYFPNVPEAAWRYELGGYPVLRKWLGYRQANRRAGRPLTLAERQHFRSMIQRLATLLALHERAHALYEQAAAAAFTAEELGVRK